MQTHQLSNNTNGYVLRTASGNYAKFQVIAATFSGSNGGKAVIKCQYIEGSEF